MFIHKVGFEGSVHVGWIWNPSCYRKRRIFYHKGSL